jgi:transcriptional regulator with XRE-family HTH domain
VVTRTEWKRQYVERLRLARLQLNLTQEEFADELGVSVAAVRLWETEQRFPSAKLRRKLERIFRQADRRDQAATG